MDPVAPCQLILLSWGGVRLMIHFGMDLGINLGSPAYRLFNGHRGARSVDEASRIWKFHQCTMIERASRDMFLSRAGSANQ